MVLASQATRPEAAQRGITAEKRTGLPWLWIILAVVVVVCAGVGYWGYRTTHESTQEPAKVNIAANSPTPIDAVVVPPTPTPSAPSAAPAVSSQVTATVVTPPPAAPSAPTVAPPTSPIPAGGASTPLAQGMKLINEGKPIEARALLSDWLNNPATPAADAEFIRETLAPINQRLVFSKEVVPGDPLVESYMVMPGDRLSRIAPKYKVPYQAIELINGVKSSQLQAGQKLKVIKGPFSAVVTKSAFRLDLYLTGADNKRVYVRSFTVGLGEGGSTPVGSFIIKPHGKVFGGGYTNPHTGETFAPGDPKNPIGKYWMALQGTDEKTLNAHGYGIHGTIDPTSIGKQMSMGCVRMGDDDITLLYKLLSDGLSTVVIQP